MFISFDSQVYEKEISLLKQAESLQKNQEESKVMEVASNIHAKLTQKKNKIEMLRTKLTACESFIKNLQKVSHSNRFRFVFRSFFSLVIVSSGAGDSAGGQDPAGVAADHRF